MIISFYNKDFEALQNNASLLIDRNNFNLVKRPVELNDFTCSCEAFTENIQPTFIVVKDDIGRSRKPLYASLAGVPILNKNNQTEINGTDLKTLFSSDVILQYKKEIITVGQVFDYILSEWNKQVNRDSIKCVFNYLDDVENIILTDLTPSATKEVYNALDEIQTYLKYYGLYIDSTIDLKDKQVVFTIGQMMKESKVQNIKLWEYGIRNYGKWLADVNETQGYDSELNDGIKWILTKDNEITIEEAKRDLYPIKRRIFVNDDITEANKEALAELLNARYNEDLEISTQNIQSDFETTFAIYVSKGEGLYKKLPCGELKYNSKSYTYDKDLNIVVKPYAVKIGFRYIGVDFI